jgi:5-hydroxyisourate hydrolase-like protein (transthyretin family)
MTSSATAAAMPGVQLTLRDFTTDEPAAFPRARGDGTFRINVRPGVYSAGARNRTLRPYASGLYNGPALPALGGTGTATGGGGAIASEATPVTLAAGYVYTLNFPLIEGGVVNGNVTDGAVPQLHPVAGISVRFDDAATDAFVESTRSDLAGDYRLWLRPGSYIVRARGQTATPTVVAFSANNNPAVLDFDAVVAHATATIFAPDGTTPRRGVKVRLYETLSANENFQGHETSNGDGTVEVYAPVNGNYLIEYKVDDGSTSMGTAIHNGTLTPPGTTTLAAGTPVAFDTAAPVALGSITLPAGGELTGIVTLGGAPAGNIRVQLRRGGTNGGSRVTNTRTQSDGSYTISAVAGPYTRVCAFVSGTSGACPGATLSSPGAFFGVNNVPLIAGQSNVQGFAIP